MTLIVTQISKYGIVFASDSNLTSEDEYAGAGKKIFELPHLNAGLCLAGSYNVNGEDMGFWMENFIATQKLLPNPSLSQFAYNLKQALENQMTPDEKSGSLIHIAGYVEKNGERHPEFWFVRNIYEIRSTGEYADIREEFYVTEDFQSRDAQNNNSLISFPKGGYQLYVNGFASGRISYLILQQGLNQFFAAIWQNPNWEFRPPQSLEESKEFIRLYMHCVNTLFLSSDYPTPYIGGDVQIYTIDSPENVKLV